MSLLLNRYSFTKNLPRNGGQTSPRWTGRENLAYEDVGINRIEAHKR